MLTINAAKVHGKTTRGYRAMKAKLTIALLAGMALGMPMALAGYRLAVLYVDSERYGVPAKAFKQGLTCQGGVLVTYAEYHRRAQKTLCYVV